LNEVKNTKVCLVSISLGKGGAERSVSIHSRMLTQLGFDVTVVILNNQIDYSFEGALYNLGADKKENQNMLVRLIRFRKFRHFLLDQQFDFIIDHRSKNNYYREVFYKNFLYKGFKSIYVTHSSKAPLYLTQFPEKFSRLCDSNVANVAVSNYIERQVLKKYHFTNTVTIPNAFDENWSNQEKSVLPESLKSRKYILWYGRMVDEIKDISFLLDAFEKSLLWEKGFDLVLMGDGPDRNSLQEKAMTLRSSAQIQFTPFTNPPDAIIRNAYFVVLCSVFEGFPMVLIEALSLGVPVVSLDIVSGPSEVIKHGVNGMLIKERNIEIFAKALTEMWTNENLYRTCRENAKASVESFSMNEIAKLWKNLLRHA
jgi:glycosyltransferase involved in cell wall biosynthesis